MSRYLALFMVLRVLGWVIGIGAFVAYAMEYQGAWSYIYDRPSMNFHLILAAYLDMLYHHIKLRLSVKQGKI